MNLRQRGNERNCTTCKNSIQYKDKSIYCNSNEQYIRDNFNKTKKRTAKTCPRYIEESQTCSGQINQLNALKFMLAGDAYINLYSDKTDEDYTYRITSANIKNPLRQEILNGVYFIKIIAGSKEIYAGHMEYDNILGIFQFEQGKNGQCTSKDLAIRSLIHVINKLLNNEYVEHLKVYHMNKCGICTRTLHKHGEINDTGICNDCLNKFNAMSIRQKSDEHLDFT